MSMYKTIFVTEEISESKKIFSVDGSVELTTAFATLEEAVAAATGNNGSKPVVVVHKVASGKYEDFVVYSSEGTTVSDVTVVAVDFNGGEAMVNGEKVSVDASGLSADAQASILAELNDNNAANGKIFVAADVAPVNAPTLYVGVDAENNYVVGSGSTTITGSSSSDISSIIENIVNNNVQTITGTETPSDIIPDAPADTPTGAPADTPSNTPSQDGVAETPVQGSDEPVIDLTSEDSVFKKGTTEIKDGAIIETTKDHETTNLYVGYDVAEGKDTEASKLTVSEGTTVSATDVINVRNGSSVDVKGTVSSGQYYIKGDVTVANDAEMILTGTNGATIKDGGKLDVIGGKVTANGRAGENNNIIIDLQKDGALNLDDATLDLSNHGAHASKDGITVAKGASVSIKNSSVAVSSIANSGDISVSGESTLNIGTLSGSSIDLLDGAIIKNSTVGGAVYVAGNVTFRGDNTFTMITDYGDYYSKDTPSSWTVEAGASLTLTKDDRYGLGYGDVVSVYGELADVRDMDAATRAEQFVSLNMYGGLVQMTNSAAMNAENKLTIENARVRFGFEGDKSFGNKPGNYYGNDTITVKNSIFETNGFKYYEAKGKTALTFTDSVVTANGVFMTNDADSTFTFDNTSVYSKATSNGSDDKNQNAGTMIFKNNSDITYSAKFTNIGSISLSNSTFTATEIVNNGTISVTISEAYFANVLNDIALITQTNDNAAALDVKVNYNGKVYGIGDIIATVNGIDYKLSAGSGNDIVIDAFTADFSVNAAYTEDTAGFGFNKFANISDAIKAAEAQGGASIDLTDVAYSGKNVGQTEPADADKLFRKNGTYTFTNGNYADFVYVDTTRPTDENAGKVDVNIVFDNAKAVVNKFRLDKGASLTINDSHIDSNNVTPSRGWTTYYGDATITINNSVVGWDIYDRGNSDHIVAGDKETVYATAGTQAGAMTWQGSGVMTVENSTIFAMTDETANSWAAYAVYDKGLMTFKDSAVYGKTIMVGVANGNKTVGRDDEVATMVFDNSVLRDINGDSATRIIVGDGSSVAGNLIVTNGSAINYNGAAMTVNNNGSVQIDNSVITVGKIINKGTVTVDAESSFSAASIVNTGKFNSKNDGEMVVLGDMTVTGNIDTDTLILKQGAVVSAGSITVDNLTLSIGSTLALSGKSSTVESITVVGDIVPENSEFTLITTGWDTILTAAAGKPSISYKGNTYTVVDYDDSLKGLQFITVGSNLYVKDFGANVTGIYIGEISANTPGYVDTNKNGIVDAGDKITDETGATYEIGKDAFTSMADAIASDALNEPGAAEKVTSVVIDADTKLSTVTEKFQNVKEVDWTIGANESVEDSAIFNGNLNLNNDGHLDGNFTITGDFNFTNTAKDTLIGEYAAYSITGINSGAMAGGYTADDKIVIDNTNGIIGAAKGEAYFGASQVEITGGDASNVTVNAGSLTLTDTTTFGLNADSTILAGKDNIWIPSDQTGKLGNIMVVGSANLSIDGDNSAIGANIENVDHTGTVTFNGEQTYTGDLAANKFVVAADSNVTVNSNQFDFNELAIAGTLSTDFTSQDSFTKAGSITGAGSFITTHSNAWIINDSVERDFSGFTGDISMDNAGASIVMGKGDAVANSTVSSYFSDDATVNIADGQSVVLAKTGINTGIDFKGAGTINVGDYTDGAFAVKSTGFTQTLSGVNSDFTGTVNVSEGATLNLDSVIGAKNINLDAPSTAATGAADATKLVLNVENAAVNAQLSGDSNDIIDVNKNQKLDTAEALNAFHGTVDLKDNTLTLNAANSTDAQFVSANGTINANADQTLRGDNSGFAGDINVAEGKTLTIENAMGAKSIDLDRDADTAVTTLKLNSEDLALKAVITGDANDIVDVQKNATLETATALNNFHGEVKVNSSTLDLDGANVTDAKFTGSADATINANADQTFRGDNSGFTGDINVAEGKTLTLQGNMGAATIDLGVEEVPNPTKLNLEHEGIILGSKITGDADDVINVNESATLSGDNSNFKGDLNITEGTTLTLQGNMGADSIVLGPTEVPNPTTLVLEKDGLALNAEITGDSDDVIDVKKNASLEKAGALDKFSGIVDTNTSSTIALNASNTTEAKFEGSGIVDVNAEQTLKGTDALTNFHGEVALEGNTINLEGVNATDAKFTSNDNAGVINAKADQIFSGDNSGFTGDLNIAEGATVTLKSDMGAATIDLGNGTATTAATLTLEKDALVLNSVISGDAADVINVKESVTLTANNENFDGIVNITGDKALTIQSNLGANTVNFGVSSDLNVTDDAVIDSKFVSTTGDTAAAVTISAGISATLSAMEALNSFSGTINTGDAASSLILNGVNNTNATITGSGLIDANVDQIFSGNVSGFGGIYDIETSVTLSGTIADEITAKGNTLNLTNATGKDIVINSTADGNLTNLNFGANDIKLGNGDADDFTNLTGTGTILDFSNDDQDYGDITAGAINVNGLEDFLTIDNLTANINITVNGAQTDDKSDVTIEQVFTGNISVTLEDGNYVQNPYKLVTNSAFDEDTIIKLFVNGQETDLQVDQIFRDEDSKKAYLLQLKDNTLILTQVHQYSNYVAIDSSWSGKVPFQSVDDEGEERIIGYDAASKLDDAVSYIKGYDTGINTLAGTNKGDATMELMSGAYKLSEGTLMTDENGVTQLILKGRDGNNVIISGTLRGSDGRLAADGTPTELYIENVRTTGYVFGGGELTIKNSASIRTSGNAIAAGIANETAGTALTMNTDTTLTINGGYFSTSVLTGGSVAFGGDVNVIGDTSVVINNTTDETLTITGNIFGGSYAADGKVTQEGDAYVWVNATKATTLRGNIYVSGFQSGKAGAELTMTGDSTITFAGSAANLTFTGTVSAIDNEATTESLVFANFNGQFNGSMIGFDTVVISGDSSLALGRRQTETSTTDLAFTINGGTKVNNAMYTVRDANAWEFSKHIIIDTTGAMAGRYVIVDNYKAGFDADFKFTVNGTEYDSITAAGLKYENGQLVYEVTRSANTIELDVDAILSGSFDGGNLEITGINKPTADTFGVKAIAEGNLVDSVLTSGTISFRGSENALEEIGRTMVCQVSGSNTPDISTDDVWAGLGVDASNDTIVVWGDTKQFVTETIAEFAAVDLTVGESYSVSTQVAPESLFNEEYKKNNNNGTLA